MVRPSIPTKKSLIFVQFAAQYALICLLVFAFLAFYIFITYQFVEGIKKVGLTLKNDFYALTKAKFQHNHHQMSVFRILAIVGAIAALIQLFVKIFTLGQYSRHQIERDPKQELIASIINCIIVMYFSCCINSLYLQIKEERLPVIQTSNQTQIRPAPGGVSVSPPQKV